MSEMQDRMRKALQQPAPGEHPSAEMLNAYAEHALTAAEQHGVAEHLAACSGCREVLFLVSACEEAERSQTTAAASLPKRRVRWWTWAVPVAAVLAVGSTVLVMHPWQTQRGAISVAKQMPPAVPTAERQEANEEKAAQPSVALQKEEAPREKAKKEAPRVEAQVRQAPSPAAEPGALGYEANNDASRDKLTESPLMATNRADAVRPAAQNAPQVSAGTIAGLNSARNAVEVAPSGQGASGGAMAARAAAPPAASNATVEVSSEATLLDAQPSTTEEITTQKAAKRAPKGIGGGAAVFAKQVDRTWVVTGTGVLEHLADGSWHMVPVAKNAYITVVTASGENVWAAARGGALYHSGDGGARWERQTVPGDPELVSLTALSATELRARTAEGKNLASHDGGKTWREQ